MWVCVSSRLSLSLSRYVWVCVWVDFEDVMMTLLPLCLSSPPFKHTSDHTHTYRLSHTHTQRDTQTPTNTHRQTQTATHTHTQTQTDTHTHTNTHTLIHTQTPIHTHTCRHSKTHPYLLTHEIQVVLRNDGLQKPTNI